DKAQHIAQQVLQDVQKSTVKDEPMSVSIGLSFSSEKEDLTLTQLIKKADKAMYVAKALGGNRVETAQEKVEG
ncbi:MAG TPA: diguanylate cyclase, partial [Ghiorsea sp.]|nr:diguanylate cyclase [Ghiorsea sp.]